MTYSAASRESAFSVKLPYTMIGQPVFAWLLATSTARLSTVVQYCAAWHVVVPSWALHVALRAPKMTDGSSKMDFGPMASLCGVSVPEHGCTTADATCACSAMLQQQEITQSNRMLKMRSFSERARLRHSGSQHGLPD